SARMVLCRAAAWEAGWLGFYTNRESEKARALAAHPHAALLLHWDGLGRQARVTGPVVAAPASDADRPFATRPRASPRAAGARAPDWEAGWRGFYTSRESERARARAAHPHAALLFHWDGLGRQARVTGPVVAAPASDADRYFATRPRESQLAAWASAQSRPVAS